MLPRRCGPTTTLRDEETSMPTPTDFEVPRHEIDREIYAMPALARIASATKAASPDSRSS